MFVQKVPLLFVYGPVDFLASTFDFISSALTWKTQSLPMVDARRQDEEESKTPHLPQNPVDRSDAVGSRQSPIVPDPVVLVHCEQGISRSASVVAFFLMRSQGWSFERALSYLKERRYVAPNAHFRSVLEKLDRESGN